MAQQFFIFSACIRQVWDGLFGDNQNVGRSLGRDVGKCEAEIIFVDDIGWNLFADDFAEDSVATHGKSWAKRRRYCRTGLGVVAHHLSKGTGAMRRD